MKELMKIAHKDGLVKTAAGSLEESTKNMSRPPSNTQQQQNPQRNPGAVGVGGQKPLQGPKKISPGAAHPAQQRVLFRSFLKKYPITNALYRGKRPKADHLIAEILRPGLPGFGGDFRELRQSVTDQKLKPKVDALYGALRQQLVNFREQINEMSNKKTKAIWFGHLQKMQQAVANKDNDMVKSAKGESQKYYDVTGETGEQLVEKAHPGGGTRTELTHSKTDENLVETIVEQQKKDLEVAKSVPKGTYANLVSLYGALSKMGYKKYLGGLKVMIKSIATDQDVIEHVLVSLANNLDASGYRKSANRVDNLLVSLADGGLNKALQRMRVPGSALERAKAQVKQYMQSGMSQDQALAKLQQSMSKGASRKTANPFWVDRGIAEYGGSMPGQDAPMSGPDGTSTPVPTGVEVEPMGGAAGNTPMPRIVELIREQRVKKWQTMYNNAIKDVHRNNRFITPLVVDGDLGPNSRAAFARVKSMGGWRKFRARMKNENERQVNRLPLSPIPQQNEGTYASVKKKVAAPNITLQQAIKGRDTNLRDATEQFLDNILSLLDAQKKEIPWVYMGEDRGNIYKMVDRVKLNISGLKGRGLSLKQAQQRSTDLMKHIPDAQSFFGGGAMFSDVVANALDQRVSRYLDQGIFFGKLVKELEANPAAAPGGTAGNIKKKKGYKRGPKYRKFQIWFNKAIERTPYERAGGNVLEVDSVFGPKTQKAWHLVNKSYGGQAKFMAAMDKKRTTKEYKKKDPAKSTTPAAPAPPQGAYKEDSLRLYKEVLSYLGNQKYPKLKGKIKGDEWRNLRQQVWDLSTKGRYTKQEIADMFDVSKMKSLRRG